MDCFFISLFTIQPRKKMHMEINLLKAHILNFIFRGVSSIFKPVIHDTSVKNCIISKWQFLKKGEVFLLSNKVRLLSRSTIESSNSCGTGSFPVCFKNGSEPQH